MTATAYDRGLDARRRDGAAAHPVVADWLRHIKGELAPGTVLMRSYHADKLLAAHPGKTLGEFTEADLESVRWDGNLSDGAWANHVSSYRSLFRDYALERGLIQLDPTRHIRRPKGKQRYLEVFTDAEVEACLGLPNDPDEDTGTGEDGFRMLLMFDTGLRIGELCALQGRDVIIGPAAPRSKRRLTEAASELVRIAAELGIDITINNEPPEVDADSSRIVGKVIVRGSQRGGGGKGNKDRVVPMTQRLTSAYAYWREVNAVTRDDYIFGHRYPGKRMGYRRPGIKHRREPLDVQTLRMWWYDALRLAGVYREWRDEDGRLQRPNPHLTRHTLATTLLRRGAREAFVAAILGHKSVQTTISLYSHLVTEDLYPTIDLLERV